MIEDRLIEILFGGVELKWDQGYEQSPRKKTNWLLKQGHL